MKNRIRDWDKMPMGVCPRCRKKIDKYTEIWRWSEDGNHTCFDCYKKYEMNKQSEGDEVFKPSEAQDQILKTLNDENKKYLDSLEIAWTIIANVSEGDWDRQTDEWKKAAENWRDNHYHKHLSDIQSLLEVKR